mmetsp:Transcript_69564/g.165134  ORF Transcript_69564/g.165134 Transcript_69564/m.165134 type:complete len:213 (+) Transcript_69564:503-1141(+)
MSREFHVVRDHVRLPPKEKRPHHFLEIHHFHPLIRRKRQRHEASPRPHALPQQLVPLVKDDLVELRAEQERLGSLPNPPIQRMAALAVAEGHWKVVEQVRKDEERNRSLLPIQRLEHPRNLLELLGGGARRPVVVFRQPDLVRDEGEVIENHSHKEVEHNRLADDFEDHVEGTGENGPAVAEREVRTIPLVSHPTLGELFGAVRGLDGAVCG